MDVSHPKSMNFGKHWTPEQVHDMFSPSQDSVEIVKQWLVDSGIEESRIQHIGFTKWLQFNATLREAENLLKTQYYAYTHLQTGEEHVSCDHYSIPEHLQQHIDLITPTVTMIKRNSKVKNLQKKSDTTNPAGKLVAKRKEDPRTKKPNPPRVKSVDLNTDLSNCNATLGPQCIKALYNFPDGTKSTPGNELGIAEWIDTLSSKDLSSFLRNFTTIPTDTKPAIVTIDGGEHARLQDDNVTYSHTETSLDIQVAMPIIYPQNAIIYQVGDDVQAPDFGDLLLAWDPDFANLDGGDTPENSVYPTPEKALKDADNNPSYGEVGYKGFTGKKQVGGVKRPNVFSSSYGNGELLLSRPYQKRQCDEYMKLGLMGTSVLYATGDSGVGSQLGCTPFNNDESSIVSAANGQSGRFLPDFPANCPYVTAVGGTMLKVGKGVEDGQQVFDTTQIPKVKNVIAGGGGFSDIFPMPAYQKEAVTSYLKDFPPPYNSSQFNSSGRAYPDLSATALFLNFVNKGETKTTGFGTSISAPLVASLITRINEERLAVNKSTVGFLNPVLYANAGAFNDVTLGGNTGCGTAGFSATKGWDPATGMGTPDYEKLLKVFMALP